MNIDSQKIEEIKSHLHLIDDQVEIRKYLTKALGLQPFIKKRKLVNLGDMPVHIEIYESKPADPVIIFVPGMGTYAEIYCEFLCKLSREGFNVVGVDLRGHGYSGGERGDYTVEQVADDLSEVVSYCTNKYNDRIALFGCSIGSPLALAAAERDSRVKALLCHTLILNELPVHFTYSLAWQYLKLLSVFMPCFKLDIRTFIDIRNVMEGTVLAALADHDNLLVWSYTINTLASVYCYRSSVVSQKKDFQSAIMIGSRDEILKVDYMREIIKCCRHPFELIVIEGGNHALQFDHVDKTISKSAAWFKRAL
jgi:alpha-beta hydrolase superfamily lysophospholipase